LEELQINQSNVKSLLGMKIIGQHGREIGVITDMFADVETWQLQSLEVKLNRETLDDLKLKRTWFGTQTVRVPVSEISGATDNLVLKSILEEMDFSGGKPAAAALLAEKGESERTGKPDERSESTT
jgi:sporulation protein YlmC with PRC-barrel domain